MRGVIYLNQGEKCMVRLLVSMHSLRKHYTGPLALIAVGRQEPWFLECVRKLGADIISVKEDGIPPLVRKARLHEHTPYDTTMFIDADTLITNKIDDYFAKIEEHTFCTGEFAGWQTSGRTIGKRIKSFAPVCPTYVDAALAYGKATNTGIFGFTRDAAILPEWKTLTERAWRNSCSRIPDEVACQLLLPRYRHWLAPVCWGVSVKFGTPEAEMRIVHYHGRKHCHPFPLCNLWKQAYWEFYYTLDADTRRHFGQSWGDRKLKRYLRGLDMNRTIVTAVDPGYLGKLKAHLPQWLRTEGIYEHPILCYVNGIDIKSPELAWLRARADLIQWDMPEAANQRERMLTAFVLGAARDVRTKWWIKIDADTKLKPDGYADFSYRLEIPGKAWATSICGHKWGYTKSKGSYGSKHFLNILDEWWQARTGEKPLFPADIPLTDRYGHDRIASFVCLHRSDFVRKCADMCKGGRLPVPSHDTFLWYCAERLKAGITRYNFKARFEP